MDIKKGRLAATAPTPNNTPSMSAPIASSSLRPAIPSIPETGESATASSDPASNPRPGDLFAGNQALVNMLQGRLGSLVGKPTGYVNSLPKQARDRVLALQGIQQDHVELEHQWRKEILVLEKRYNELFMKGYQRRSELISGTANPTAEEVLKGKQLAEVQAEEEEEKKEEKDEEKGIDEFWLTALKNHVHISEMITERDEPALSKLRDIRIVYDDDCMGYRLEFEFAKNEWFENSVLTKKYRYELSEYDGEVSHSTAEGCDILWKSGKDLSVEVITKKQRSKTTKKTRTLTQTVPAETFFRFFKVPTVDDLSSDEDDDDDEEGGVSKEERLEMVLDEDFEVADEIKSKIIPHAVDWFTGKALEYEDIGMDYDEDDYDEDDSSEEEEDSD